jgi:hypothetical protein
MLRDEEFGRLAYRLVDEVHTTPINYAVEDGSPPQAARFLRFARYLIRSKAERVRIAGDRSEALRGGDCTGPEVRACQLFCVSRPVIGGG